LLEGSIGASLAITSTIRADQYNIQRDIHYFVNVLGAMGSIFLDIHRFFQQAE
jgi:hypothetical protein